MCNFSITSGGTGTRNQPKERLEGKIERSFIIPEEYDLSKTSAKFENGLLTITIEEYVKQEREIEISVK